MVTCLTHGDGVGGREGGEGGVSVEQKEKSKGVQNPLFKLFVFTSWLIGTFDY